VILQDAFTVEPWNLRETHLDLDLLAQTESVFALANGHVGWRANLDEPFGEEPPGVWGSLDGHLPWETALREPSRLVQTGSRPTSHRGGHWFDPSIAHQVRALCRPL